MPEGTDMVSVLVTDHNEMKDYFRELEAAADAKARRDSADELTAEVARHSVAERTRPSTVVSREAGSAGW